MGAAPEKAQATAWRRSVKTIAATMKLSPHDKLVGSSRLYAQHTWRACRSGGPETYREQARARTRSSGREDDPDHDDLPPLRRDDDLEGDPDHA